MFVKIVIFIGFCAYGCAALRQDDRTDRNTTSISTDGGCRLSIEDIIFTRIEASGGGKKAKKSSVYVEFHYLVNDTRKEDLPCGNSSGTISLTYQGIPWTNPNNDKVIGLDTFNITWVIQYQKKFGWWDVTEISLNAIGAMTDNKEINANWTGKVMESVAMGASDKFSYACSAPRMLMYSDDKVNGPTYQLRFKNFQLQPFEYISRKPSPDGFTDNVDDCVAFFSASVWMALLTLLIFVLIILSGVVMLSNMSTVNRFDDPKAKQLVITAKD